MQTIYVMILVFLVLLFYLDYREKNYHYNKENKENFNNNDLEKEHYCNKTDDSLNRTMNNPNSINLDKKQSNFTTNGLNPFLRCPQCFMKFDCSNYPYNIDDLNKTLCTTCIDKNSDPYKVLGKQPGRPRNCQNLYN